MKPANALALSTPSDLSFAAMLAALQQARAQVKDFPQVCDVMLKVSAQEGAQADELLKHLKTITDDGDPLVFFRDMVIAGEKRYARDEWSVVFRKTDGGDVLAEVWTSLDEHDTSLPLEIEKAIAELALHSPGGISSIILTAPTDETYDDGISLSMRYTNGEASLGNARHKFTNERPHLKVVKSPEWGVVLASADGRVIVSASFDWSDERGLVVSLKHKF